LQPPPCTEICPLLMLRSDEPSRHCGVKFATALPYPSARARWARAQAAAQWSRCRRSRRGRMLRLSSCRCHPSGSGVLRAAAAAAGPPVAGAAASAGGQVQGACGARPVGQVVAVAVAAMSRRWLRRCVSSRASCSELPRGAAREISSGPAPLPDPPHERQRPTSPRTSSSCWRRCGRRAKQHLWRWTRPERRRARSSSRWRRCRSSSSRSRSRRWTSQGECRAQEVAGQM
jgi:hypothetical protein